VKAKITIAERKREREAFISEGGSYKLSRRF